MKKILSVIMMVLMILGMPMYSLASEGMAITQDSQEKSGNTNVDYNLEETYTVIFPASVTFTDTEKSIDRGLQVSDVVLQEGHSINVNVVSLNDFHMKNKEGSIAYQLIVNNNDDKPVENNSTILTVDAGKKAGVAILTFITELDKSKAPFAGRYSDTLTFTVSVE